MGLEPLCVCLYLFTITFQYEYFLTHSLVADLNYGVILAHRAERLERRERRKLYPLPKVGTPQACSVPTARLFTPAVPAWEMPQWQRKLHQWPATRVVEATQGEPEETMELQPPPSHAGLLPHAMADVVQESNAVCDDEHVIATSADTEVLDQNPEVEQSGLKAKPVSSDFPVHHDKQQSEPQTKIANLSCSSAGADRESKTASDRIVVHPVEETHSRQVSESSEAARAPSPALLKSEATRKPVSPTMPPIATDGAKKLEQCSTNNEQLLSISPPSDDRPVPVTSDTAKEALLPLRELSDDDRHRPSIAQPSSTPPLDVLVGHDNFVHSPSPTFEEQGGHGVNPLWQVALGGIPDDSQKETVSDVNTATNELNVLSRADDDVTHPVTPVEGTASASRYDHADVEQLYEVCLAQLTSDFVLR